MIGNADSTLGKKTALIKAASDLYAKATSHWSQSISVIPKKGFLRSIEQVRGRVMDRYLPRGWSQHLRLNLSRKSRKEKSRTYVLS